MLKELTKKAEAATYLSTRMVDGGLGQPVRGEEEGGKLDAVSPLLLPFMPQLFGRLEMVD